MVETDTRTRLMEASYQLMLSQGYAATGVGEICRTAGVSKGSFYHFFESKQKCALAMLDYHMDEARRMIEQRLDLSGLDPVEAAIQYVACIADLSEELFRDGCLVGAFALELAETHPELQAQVAQVFAGTADEFEKMLRPICEASSDPAGPSPRELAEQMLMVIEGGVVLSKAHRDRRFIGQGLRCFLRYLDTLRPITPASRT